MTDVRRYDEEEIAAIFAAAATPASPASPPSRDPATSHGLTLADLQEIGREVGVEPARIAEAAAAIDRHDAAPVRRTSVGVPVAVRRVVPLPRAPTDREWAILVAELRDEFRARGRDVSQGELRGWTNGNLHAYVEPTPDGWRLRLGTLKGDALAYDRAAIFTAVFGLLLLLVMLAAGEPASELVAPLLLLAAGATGAGANALRLPPWARERGRQMDRIASRAQRLLASAPADVEGGARRS